MIDITDLVQEDIVRVIKQRIRSIESKSLKAIKEGLPNDITYSEIQFVLAHMEAGGY